MVTELHLKNRSVTASKRCAAMDTRQKLQSYT
nr:MAG TPA: hypothetical protein [Caudoviricetes sp.]